VEPATLTPCCGRAAAARSSHSSAGKASSDQAARPLGPTLTTQRGRRQLPTDGRCSRASSLSGSATRSTWPHCQPLPTTTTKSKSTLRLAQHGLRQLRGPGSNLGQTTRRRGHGGDHARDLFPVGHSGHRNARTPDAGRWRPDSGHLDAQTPAPDTVNWTGPVEHRTLDTGCQTRTRTRWRQHSRHLDLPGHHASDRTLRRPTVRVLSHYQPAARPLRRPSRAPAHSCPQTITGRG
jgi:hypothetical protein